LRIKGVEMKSNFPRLIPAYSACLGTSRGGSASNSRPARRRITSGTPLFNVGSISGTVVLESNEENR